ncbi:MAG: glycosyltransferase family 2 protein, partial [Deltaproteobacteria bacterium]|nr:glycosyltransferase family 2 protein [Deltaproteobacteria bacterium]
MSEPDLTSNARNTGSHSKAGNTPVSPEISIIVPIYNEAANVKALVEQTLDVMRPLGRSFELILIDDGSTDGSHELLRAVKRDHPELRVILLRRNFGQSAAMTAGFDHAAGDIVVTMDGDLQNDPRNIPLMINKLEEGYDLVNGWRRDRQDPFLSRRLPSMIANRLIGMASGVRLHDYGCSLKAYRGELARNLL